jgi:hypothetical protein
MMIDSEVTLEIFDADGSKIATVYNDIVSLMKTTRLNMYLKLKEWHIDILFYSQRKTDVLRKADTSLIDVYGR